MSVWESINSVEELLQLLHNEAEINSFLFRMKWPSGFVCPRCHLARLMSSRLVGCRSMIAALAVIKPRLQQVR